MPRLAAAVDPGPQVRGGERLGDVGIGPAPRLRRDEQAVGLPLLQEAPDERLAAAVAVDVGRVEEGHAGVHRGVQDGEGVALVDLTPVGTELPAPQPDDADLLPGPAQPPRLHVDRP